MFLRFSEDAQKLLLLSLKEKNKFKSEFIGSEHIVLALLSMKNNIRDFFDGYNINYKNFSLYIKNGASSNGFFLFSPIMSKIFKNLNNNFNNKKSNEVLIEDILGEILNEPSSRVNYIFRKMGIDSKNIIKGLNIEHKKKKTLKKGILNEIGVNLNNSNFDDVLIGRDEEINDIIEILCCRNKNNPILIGDAGVGKTAIVEELARRIENGNVPFKLKGKKIYSVSMSSLVAGTKYRGEFEEKINKLILEVENNEDIILFIDEIHTLVGAGGADGAIDASNILKPALARGLIKIIGATTKDEYNKYFLDDKALNRRFRVVLCEEPSYEKTLDILNGIKSVYENYHNVLIDDNIVEQIVYYSNKYIRNRKFPDKAIDLLDEVCVFESLERSKDYLFINKLNQEINDILLKKNNALLRNDYKKAMEYSQEEKNTKSILNKKQINYYKNDKISKVKEDSLLKIIEKKTNIPFFTYKNINKVIKDYKKTSLLENNCVERICLLTKNLFESLVNQSKVFELWITSTSNGLNNYFINDYIKTFFKRNNIINIDVNGYRNIDELLNNNDKNSLINKINLYPFSILVISNYDKCDNSIKEFLENVREHSYYLDRNNDKVDFSNILLIYSVLNKTKIGFENKDTILNNYINIECLDSKKIINLIKNKCLKSNIGLGNDSILKIKNLVINNYNNLNNIDYLIKMERDSLNKKRSNKRTIKI